MEMLSDKQVISTVQEMFDGMGCLSPTHSSKNIPAYFTEAGISKSYCNYSVKA